MRRERMRSNLPDEPADGIRLKITTPSKSFERKFLQNEKVEVCLFLQLSTISAEFFHHKSIVYLTDQPLTTNF